MPLVRTEGLTKAFGALTAVNAVTLEVQEGALHSVIGPNGAGKTTFFNLLTGQLAPTAGRIVFDGRDIAGTPPHKIAHLGIARSFQRTSIFPTLSIADNVWLAAFARHDSWRGLAWRRADRYPELLERAQAALGEVGLADKAGQPARFPTASSGSSSWPSRSPRPRGSCCWTSRRPGSPRTRPRRWWGSCGS